MVLKILYYYYYLFYKKSGIEDQPHMSAIFSLSFVFTLFLLNLFKTIAFVYCFQDKYLSYGVFIAIFLASWYYFSKMKNGIRIVNQKPKLFKSDTISIIFVVFFTVFNISLLFWFSDFLRTYYKC